MAHLTGLSRGVQFVQPAGGTPGGRHVSPAANASAATPAPNVIDGTPVRVVVLALSAAAGLVALHMAGFRFNIGVSA